MDYDVHNFFWSEATPDAACTAVANAPTPPITKAAMLAPSTARLCAYGSAKCNIVYDPRWVDEDAEDIPTDETLDPYWGVCLLIEQHDYHHDTPAPVSAFTRDGSDYRSNLHTRADFGCVLWEPKP